LLGGFRDELKDVEPFTAEVLETTLHDFIAKEGIAANQIVHALRIALTGKPVGFGLFDILAILGRERALARLERAIAR
jgi:glutamyl-tRNA synthetase